MACHGLRHGPRAIRRIYSELGFPDVFWFRQCILESSVVQQSAFVPSASELPPTKRG